MDFIKNMIYIENPSLFITTDQLFIKHVLEDYLSYKFHSYDNY